jgi:hypothetical protein
MFCLFNQFDVLLFPLFSTNNLYKYSINMRAKMTNCQNGGGFGLRHIERNFIHLPFELLNYGKEIVNIDYYCVQ